MEKQLKDAQGHDITPTVVSSADDIVSLNQDKQSYVLTNSVCVGRDTRQQMYNETTNKCTHKWFTLAHLSDSHDREDSLKRAINLLDSSLFPTIDALCHTGDMMNHKYGDTPDYLNALNDYTGSKPVYIVLGNHDQSAMYGKQISGIYSRYIQPMIAKGYIAVGTDIQANKTYYKFDVDSYKLRFICLNDFEWLYDGMQNTYYNQDWCPTRWSQDQIDFLVQQLTSCPSNYTVVILRHAIDNGAIAESKSSRVGTMIDNVTTISGGRDNNVWTTFRRLGETFGATESLVTNDSNAEKGRIVMDVLNAYKNKTKLTQTYSYNDTTISAKLTSGISVNADFTNANGELSVIIAGHHHSDIIGKDSKYNIPIIVIAGAGLRTEGGDCLTRWNCGRTQDLLNVYSFDTVQKRVRITRLGADMQYNSQKRECVSVPY